MSLATVPTRETRFLTRFERLRSSLLRYQVCQGMAWSAMAAALGLAAMAAADHRLELPFRARAVGLAAVGIAVLVVAIARVVLPLRWWTRPRTAAEIEGRFPRLGQRIRTIVQYGGLDPGEVEEQGVTPGLVAALEDETEAQADPLPLDRVVPWSRAGAVAAAVGVAIVGLIVAAAIDREWRIAIGRALLGQTPYTTIAVAPGDIRVDRGADVAVVADLAGRMRDEVTLQAREEGRMDESWRSIAMTTPDGEPASRRSARLSKVGEPTIYRVVAGSEIGPAYRIDVRYPLAVKAFEIDLKPPAYTGVAPSTVKGGDLKAIVRTEAVFRVAFEGAPATVAMVLTDRARAAKGKEPPAARVIPMKPEGGWFRAGLAIDRDWSYRIEASSSDGRELPETRYKIDVIEDRAPRVTFLEPDEALEVHPVAEVVYRVRVADDFGLARAGIMFQFGEGDEQGLIVKDFAAGRAGRETSATIGATLLLEKLAASPRDSVTYYAFAEDNDPAGPKRTETELRYIDIRPFKREYRMAEPGDDPGGEPSDLATLAELIARQRFNLNRMTRLARHRPGDGRLVDDPLKIAGFEETLAELTRALSEGVEGIIGRRIEPLHQAEESMLAAVAVLDRGRIEPAPRHMADALRRLIEARDTIRVLIGDEPGAARALRSFDRTQAQKIRKPKKDRENEEEIIAEIESLAQNEDFVYATLSGLKMDDPSSKGRSAGSGEPEKKDARRVAADRQEEIADRARELEEALEKLEKASDLARARMTKAAGAAERASVDLARGSTKEAAGSARQAAAMLHELARQLRGELAPDVADELAMSRDLADELARREAELARMPDPGQGSGLAGLEEAGRTLEHWLQDASLRAEGPSADRVKAALDEADAGRVAERIERAADLARGGDREASRREAGEVSGRLERLARLLDALHRDIVAPELAKLAEFDRRVTELASALKELRSDADIADWHRRAAELIRKMDRAGLEEAAAPLVSAIADLSHQSGSVRWDFGYGNNRLRVAPASYPEALMKVAGRIEQRMQDQILRDMASDRDEATPPRYREMVDRYFEVLSRGGAK